VAVAVDPVGAVVCVEVLAPVLVETAAARHGEICQVLLLWVVLTGGEFGRDRGVSGLSADSKAANRTYARYNLCGSREQNKRMTRVALYMTRPGPRKLVVCIELHRSPGQALGDMPAAVKAKPRRTGGWPGVAETRSGMARRPGWTVETDPVVVLDGMCPLTTPQTCHTAQLMITRFRGVVGSTPRSPRTERP
jgi:hypothetical protein